MRAFAKERHFPWLSIAETPLLRSNTATLMREHGIKEIYTRDMDFHRFPFLTVLDPAA